MNWLDLVRVIAAGIGLLYTSIIFKRSINDVENTKDDRLAHQSAITSAIVFLGGTVTQFTFLLTGIFAIVYRPPIDATDITFIISSIISCIFARIIYVRRRELLVELYKQQHKLKTLKNGE